MEGPGRLIPWRFDSRNGLSNYLILRWIFLRAQYAPTLTCGTDGKFAVVGEPDELPRHE
jgi:hypothetical protein